MSLIRAIPKTLDQPLLIHKLCNHVYWMLPVAGAATVAHQTLQNPEGDQKKSLIKSSIIVGSTVVGALLAFRYFMQPGKAELREMAEETLEHLKEQAVPIQGRLKKFVSKIETALKQKGIAPTSEPELAQLQFAALESYLTKLGKANHPELKALIEKGGQFDKAQGKILTVGEMSRLSKALKEIAHTAKETDFPKVKDLRTQKMRFMTEKERHNFLVSLASPDPHFADSAHILGEIVDLSLMGLVPVGFGFAGGLLGNAAIGKDWKADVKDMAKEASFQYLANIVLCNVGAGVFLKGLESMPFVSQATKHNPMVRLGTLVSGIAMTGIIFGSWIANVIGNNILNPMIDRGVKDGFKELRHQIKHEGTKSLFKDVYKERTPRFQDMILHLDDLVTAAVIAGLGWMKALLPFLYSVSGHQTGVGYRTHKSTDNALSAPSDSVALTQHRNAHHDRNDAHETREHPDRVNHTQTTLTRTSLTTSALPVAFYTPEPTNPMEPIGASAAPVTTTTAFPPVAMVTPFSAKTAQKTIVAQYA